MSFKLATLSLMLLALQGCAPARPAPKTSELSAAPTRQVAEDSKKKVPGPEDRENHLSDILSSVLDYALAGEEQAAWAFYEEAYRPPDKAEMKRKIQAELSALPLYRFTCKGKSGR